MSIPREIPENVVPLTVGNFRKLKPDFFLSNGKQARALWKKGC